MDTNFRKKEATADNPPTRDPAFAACFGGVGGYGAAGTDNTDTGSFITR